ncbi:DnaJ family domain-containing protein [Salininema proteolyticum]|uniref:DUF1992 domain-containing protein n=1 Tax=Salininema proteolyticum TaxID=1607685 RepID=A0ABV8U158_9ACTN
MSGHRERGVESAIEQAIRQGAFDDLPGAGKPLENLDTSEGWWLRQKSTREKIGEEALPATIRLRKELDELEDRADGFTKESDLREYLEDLNARLKKALMYPGDGPPINRGLVDIDEEVAAWSDRKNP